ncbi:hypothetical protein ACCO45_010468 [Purpureocillium lilacinum]|uniref:Uncharacterized protein n=1 Tax=Purpureocillium lilacinum TaxID=33203 RepID=A0ACC4DHY3_PURLI
MRPPARHHPCQCLEPSPRRSTERQTTCLRCCQSGVDKLILLAQVMGDAGGGGDRSRRPGSFRSATGEWRACSADGGGSSCVDRGRRWGGSSLGCSVGRGEAALAKAVAAFKSVRDASCLSRQTRLGTGLLLTLAGGGQGRSRRSPSPPPSHTPGEGSPAADEISGLKRLTSSPCWPQSLQSPPPWGVLLPLQRNLEAIVRRRWGWRRAGRALGRKVSVSSSGRGEVGGGPEGTWARSASAAAAPHSKRPAAGAGCRHALCAAPPVHATALGAGSAGAVFQITAPESALQHLRGERRCYPAASDDRPRPPIPTRRHGRRAKCALHAHAGRGRRPQLIGEGAPPLSLPRLCLGLGQFQLLCG